MNEIMDDYDAGVQAGYAKSICLIRHLQRTLSSQSFDWDDFQQRDILEEAMELISKEITDNE